MQVRATIDSGAAVSVVSNDWFTDYAVKVTAENGSSYRAAGGAIIKDEGLRQLSGLMPGDRKAVRKLNVRVAKVRKMLLSVGKIVDAGNQVVFDKKFSSIKNLQTGTKTEIHRDKGVCVLDFEVLGSKVASGEPGKMLAGLTRTEDPSGRRP